MKDHKLSIGQIFALAFTLFAMFFGAGNMIFPPSMGQEAGTHVWIALAGYLFTDAGLPILAIAAVVLFGNNLTDLASKVGMGFATVITILVYLSIGPMFAIPRTASTSFELAVYPFLPAGVNVHVALFLMSVVYFGIVYWASAKPQAIVNIVGKLMTPALLLAIFVTGVGIVLHPIGTVGAPIGNYMARPFPEGMIQGYQTLDAFAAPVFAAIIIDSIRSMNVTRKENIVKYTMLSGMLAVVCLGIVYGILAYAGAASRGLGTFPNGGQLLTAITYAIFGKAGTVIIGIAVLLACLTTAVGLTTACGSYFSQKWPRFSYRTVITLVVIFGCIISNIGLTQLITITLPLLLALYPIIISLVLLAFLDKPLKGRRSAHIGVIIGAALISIPNGLEALAASFGFPSLGVVSTLLQMVPFYDLMLGWVIPAAIGGAIGYIINK